MLKTPVGWNDRGILNTAQVIHCVAIAAQVLETASVKSKEAQRCGPLASTHAAFDKLVVINVEQWCLIAFNGV